MYDDFVESSQKGATNQCVIIKNNPHLSKLVIVHVELSFQSILIVARKDDTGSNYIRMMLLT